jgi:integrase
MTPKQIEALPQGTYPISTHPGLRLEVRAGRKTWTLRRRDGEGKLKQQVVGHWPAMSLVKAAAECEALRTTGIATKPDAVVTVRAVLRSYIVGHLQANRKDRGVAPSATLWRHIGDLIDRDASGVGRADAHALVQSLAGRVSVQRLMRMELAAAWEWAISAGLLGEHTSNPWQKVKAPPPVSRSRVLSDSEVQHLFKWMGETGLGSTTIDAMKLTLFTGMRSGEVVAMRWKDIDLAAGTYQMMDSKNGLSRVVYLNDLAITVLQGRGRETGFVFPTRDGRGSVEQHILVNALYRVRESLGLDDFTIHVLRKTMLNRPGFHGGRLV